MKIGALINELAAKAKVDLTDPKYATVLGIDTDLPDDVATQINNSLLTEELGKNNANLKSHFKHSFYAGLDAKIKELADAAGLDPSDLVELDAEKNSNEKIGKLLKAREKAVEKLQAGKSGDKAGLIEKINELNAQIVSTKDTAKAEIAAIRAQAENEVMDYAINSELSSFKYANKDLPSDVHVLTAKTLLNKALQEKGAKIVRKDGKLKLIQSANPELDFMENNKEISFQDLAKSTLASNKLLEVTEPAKPVKTPQRQQPAENTRNTQDNSKAVIALRADAAALMPS